VADALLDEYPKLVNLQGGKDNVSPLMAAASSDHHTMVVKLMNHRADATAVNALGQNAAWIAARNAQQRALKALTSHLGRATTPARVVLDKFAPPLKPEAGQEAHAQEPQYQQHTTPLMIATIFGHVDVVQVLLFAKANPDLVSPDAHAPQSGTTSGGAKSAIELAAMNGSEVLVKLLVAHGAKALARAREVAEQHGHTHLKIHRQDSREQRTVQRQAVLQRSSSYKTDPFFDAAKLKETTESLTWDRKKAFPGQLVPPRPSLAEVHEGATPLGKVVAHRGVILQRGPFNGIFVRVGCIPRHPWIDLWLTLRELVNYYLQTERANLAAREEEMARGDTDKKYIPCAVYVVVSLRSMQAIDFSWLVNQGFHFHHYRAPGHGDTPPADPAAPLAHDEATAEFVYYCWPGTPETDMVPNYATAIEGATGLCFSPDGAKVLLVWERGSWSTPGGAVNAGESKIDALARELREEVGVEVDFGTPPQFLAGWSESRARDNLVNDSFCAFAVRLKSLDYSTDKKEIFEAVWFDAAELLAAWGKVGKPLEKKVEMDMGRGPERGAFAGNMLKWLDTYSSGHGHVIKYKESMQGDKKSVKASWGMAR